MGLYTKSLIAGITLSLCINIQLHAEQSIEEQYDYTQLSIIKTEHPSSEPEGLFVTVFSIKDMEHHAFYQFNDRIYCPTMNVRNISQGVKNAPMRTVEEEDKANFKGNSIIAEVANFVCTKENQDNIVSGQKTSLNLDGWELTYANNAVRKVNGREEYRAIVFINEGKPSYCKHILYPKFGQVECYHAGEDTMFNEPEYEPVNVSGWELYADEGSMQCFANEKGCYTFKQLGTQFSESEY